MIAAPQRLADGLSTVERGISYVSYHCTRQGGEIL